MSNKVWFRAKTYGWGWTPVTWQGWIVTIIFAVLIGFSIARNSTGYTASQAILGFSPQVILLIAALLCICYKKGEKPSWRWGNKKK